MAVIALAVALLGFCSVKLFTILISSCTTKHGLKMLWEIAVLQHLKAEMDKSNNECDDNKFQEWKKIFGEKDKNVYNDFKYNRYNVGKTATACSLLIVLILMMAFVYFAYDLHPLACLALPNMSSEDTIEYYPEDSKVIIRVAELRKFQITAAIISGVFILLF